jgi:indolepyruvate ferredoxin oxidoreductase
VGGTGVVTIGQLLGMAAHLEGKALSVLDMAGLAQKGGAVFSHVQIAATPAQLHATRIAMGEADLVLGCDLVTTATNEALSKIQAGTTRAVINSAESPTADFVKNPDWSFGGAGMTAQLREAIGEERNLAVVDATALATALMGDALYTNPFMLGFAWQKGWLPLTRAALVRAIELNEVAIEANKRAFQWGRLAAVDIARVKEAAAPTMPVEAKIATTLEDIVAARGPSHGLSGCEPCRALRRAARRRLGQADLVRQLGASSRARRQASRPEQWP